MATRRRRRTAATALVLAIALAAGACGDETSEQAASTTSSGTSASEAALAPFCDDVEPPGPIADGNVPPTGNPAVEVMTVLDAYGLEHSDTFGGLWIDRTHDTVVLAFTDDPDAHRAAIAERRPSPDDPPIVEPAPATTDTTSVAESGTSFDVVQVRYTAAELEAMQERVATEVLADGVPGLSGAGRANHLNRVTLWFDVVDDGTRRRLAEVLPLDAVCVEGTPAAEAPEPVDPNDPPTLLPPADQVRLTCGGESLDFPPSALQEPGGFESADDPLAAALREALTGRSELTGVGTPTGWRVLARTDGAAVVVDQDLNMVQFEHVDSRWVWAGSGGCTPEVVLADGVGRAAIALDPAFPPPGPGDTELHLLVNELACASAEPIGDRLVGPQVRYEDDQVVVAAAAISLRGAQTCPGIMAEPVTVTLDEPIGNRTVIDGLVWPVRALSPPDDTNGVFGPVAAPGP